jgi:hypothetical protein
MQLGYQVEEGFDLSVEQRRDRLWWVVVGGCALLGLVYVIHPFFLAIFQTYCLSLLSYGDTFYVHPKKFLRGTKLWKVVLQTIPVHLIFLAGFVALDLALPQFATKVIVSLTVLYICFGVECVIFDKIRDRHAPDA